MSKDSLAERVMERIEFSKDGCWLWLGGQNGNGYGRIEIGGGRRARVHRVVYEASVGPIPDGLDLDHLCRVRHCVNPDHLEPVTRSENLKRSPLVGTRDPVRLLEMARRGGLKGGPATKGRKLSPNQRAAIGRRMKVLWRDPAYRTKVLEARQKARVTRKGTA